MTEIVALTLTPAERGAILTFWPSVDDFMQWQRNVLAAEVMRRAQTAVEQQSREAMDTATDEVMSAFPSLFPEPAEPPAEPSPQP